MQVSTCVMVGDMCDETKKNYGFYNESDYGKDYMATTTKDIAKRAEIKECTIFSQI